MPLMDSVHSKQFKNTNRHEEMRRRRNETSVELRKQKKEEQLMKRRNVEIIDEDEFDKCPSPEAPQVISDLSLKDCLEAFNSGEIFKGAMGVRRVLSQKHDQVPIDKVLASGLLPYLVQALSNASSKIRFEAAWAITNVTAGNSAQTWTAVNSGILPPIITMLSSESDELCEQATWCIGNMIGDSGELRNHVIKSGGLAPILTLAQKPDVSVSFMRVLAWTLSNLGRHQRPEADIEALKAAKPLILQMAKHADKHVQQDAIWALAYMSDGSDDRIALVAEPAIIGDLVALVVRGDLATVAPALRALGNIATGDDDVTQKVIDSGLLSIALPNLLNSTKMSIQKEAAWLTSNIAAGPEKQIQSLVFANIMPHIVRLLQIGEHRVRIECVWVINNYISGGNGDQIAYLINVGVVSALSDLLTTDDTKLVFVILESLNGLLRKSYDLSSAFGEHMAMRLEECGGLDKLEELQQHDNEEIYKQAMAIIEEFFGESEEEQETREQQDNNNDATTANQEPCGLNVPAAPVGGFNF
jgi:importin subunit alpha-2